VVIGVGDVERPGRRTQPTGLEETRRRPGAIIPPGQSAILAVGAIQPKPVVVDDQVMVRQRMRVTLSGDHRVFYGAEGAQFLQELRRLLENPISLVY